MVDPNSTHAQMPLPTQNPSLATYLGTPFSAWPLWGSRLGPPGRTDPPALWSPALLLADHSCVKEEEKRVVKVDSDDISMFGWELVKSPLQLLASWIQCYFEQMLLCTLSGVLTVTSNWQNHTESRARALPYRARRRLHSESLISPAGRLGLDSAASGLLSHICIAGNNVAIAQLRGLISVTNCSWTHSSLPSFQAFWASKWGLSAISDWVT